MRLTMLQNDSDRRRAQTARAAVALAFASFGLIMATWAVHLPSMQAATGASTAMLGTLLLTSGVGALSGMQLAGRLVDHYGSMRVVGLSSALMACAVVVPLTATSLSVAMLGAFIFGLTAGVPDVAMNAAAVQVERVYDRPIMASFHAMFSVGNVIGSLISAAGFALGVSVLTAVVSAVIPCLAAAAFCTFGVRPGAIDSPGRAHAPTVQADERPPRRSIFMLGALAFLFLFAEGSALDWSALHARQHLSATPTVSAIAFASIVIAMTVGRLTVDRLVPRLGPGRIVRWGALVALAGFIVVMASPVLPVTVIGWVLVGLGISGGLPQIYTATGNLGPGAGRALARVVGLGYIAILAGPAVIGWTAELSSINVAFALPALAVLACAVAGGVVMTSRPRAHADCESCRQ
jgi:MFS family permease